MLPPILKNLNPSEEQRRAIATTGSDVLVTAGAGSGKTRTLVGRFLYLLAAGVDLRSIVAITFTRQAAREMRNRIRAEVQNYLRNLPAGHQDLPTWQAIYSQMDAARAGTIHSLCADILRSHPAEAGIDPRFETLEEGAQALLQAEAVQQALAWAAAQPQCVQLFLDQGENGVSQVTSALLAARLDAEAMLRAMPAHPQTLLQQWQQLLAARQQPALRSLMGDPVWSGACERLRTAKPLDAEDRLAGARSDALRWLDKIQADQELLPARLGALASIAGLRSDNVGSQKNWAGGSSEVAAVRTAIAGLRECIQARPELNFRLNALDEEMASLLPPIRDVALQAMLIYQGMKTERRALDFDDLEAEALRLLNTNPDVLAAWRRQIQALLVDEFQDTNHRQQELIRLLDGGRGCMFLVGDAKQSIYRFRGADVTVFREERQRIPAGGGQVAELNVTYRSHAGLVRSLNALLRPVLGDVEDVERPWHEPFAELAPERQDAVAGFRSPHVELILALGTKSEGALERAAAAAVERVAVLVREGVCALDDVAVLCRAASGFPAYEDAFEQAGLPYLTVAGKGFYERPEVRDLLVVLQALEDPNYDLALAGALRSPALGLSDASLFRLVDWQQQEHSPPPLWQVLRQRAAHLADGEAGRAQRAQALIASFNARVGRATVADVLKAFLGETSYQAMLHAAGQARAAGNVSKLLADAQVGGFIRVGDLLDYVRLARAAAVREGEARVLAEGAARIMTVHRAKGLEFPVVILGDMAYAPPAREAILLHDQGFPVLRRKSEDKKSEPGMWAWARQVHSDREQSEDGRLFYVAATRAREHLILNGTATLNRSGQLGARGWLRQALATLDLLQQDLSALQQPGAAVLAFEADLGEEKAWCRIYPQSHRPSLAPPATSDRQPLDVDGLLPAGDPLLGRPQSCMAEWDEAGEEAASDPPRRVWRVVPDQTRLRAPAWTIGRLVHKAIEYWHFPTEHAARPWLEAQARGLGLTHDAQIRDAVGRVLKLLLRLQAHPLWTEIAGAEVRYHEVPYTLAAGATDVRGAIDLLYRAGGRWHIVDFKTDRLRDPQDLRLLLSDPDHEYWRQLRRYQQAAEALLGERPAAVLCLLDAAGGLWVEELGRDGEASPGN